MRSLKMLILVLILSLVSVGIAQDTTQPPLETRPQASVIILPHDTYFVFSTREHAMHEYPDVFKAIEADGHRLLGYTFIPGDIDNGKDKKKTTILIMVDDPSMYTRAYVERLALILFNVNTPEYDVGHLDLLLDKTPEEWEVAGILQHELSHMSDMANPKNGWYGRQRVLLFDLFPHVLPQPPINEPRANPWAVLKMWWPIANTHKGYSERVY